MQTLFFCNVFYECIVGKSAIYLVLAMFIDDVWLIDLIIIYIKKTIVKALDIGDIIKNIIGMLAPWVQNSQQIIKFDNLLKFENKIYIRYFHIMRSPPPLSIYFRLFVNSVTDAKYAKRV